MIDAQPLVANYSGDNSEEDRPNERATNMVSTILGIDSSHPGRYASANFFKQQLAKVVVQLFHQPIIMANNTPSNQLMRMPRSFLRKRIVTEWIIE